MRKIILRALLMAALLLASQPVPVKAQPGAPSGAMLRAVVDKQTLRSAPHPFFQDKTLYVPLRAIAEKLGGTVNWDAPARRAVVVYENKTREITGVLKGNNLMARMEDVSSVFNVKAAYVPAFSCVVFDGEELPPQESLLNILPNFEKYSGEDVHWLSRIVEAEATGEGYESRLAVASVILNRRRDAEYPDTIEEVIFDKRYGVQFTPTANGSIYNEPTTLSFIAALDALDGKNNAPGALFFMNPRYATSFWMQKNRQFAFTIGGHSYYY
ncbi:MAG: cell wall hydrolase [Clostridiales bacterium]|jgi:hypothetical protein|nr:cell wall hydrolase [Clostridiales bacterium]